MDNLLERYWHYKKVLEKMGSLPLSKYISIKDLGLSRGVIQSSYKEMNKPKFGGTIIDYLCWINTVYILTETNNQIELNCRIIVPEINFLNLTLHVININTENKKRKKQVTEIELGKSFLKLCLTTNNNETKNMVRLWRNNATVFNNLYSEIIDKEFTEFFSFELFREVVSEIYYDLLDMELNPEVK